MGLAAGRSHTPFTLLSETPDWSQLATKADLDLQLRDLRVSVREDMAGLRENMEGMSKNISVLDVEMRKNMLTLAAKIEGLKGSTRVSLWIPLVGSLAAAVFLAMLPVLQEALQKFFLS